jgi:hypothetical protein
MKRVVLTLAVALAAIAAGPQQLFAQATDTDTQTFTVTVAPILSINAPITGGATIAHDTTDTNQVFPLQTWSALCNNGLGASIDFVITPFANGTTERNAQLVAAVLSSDASAAWAMTTASATTDYLSATPNATVSAASEGPGNASFGLTVTFIDSDYSVLPAGSFVSTVTGTITAN